MIIWELIRFGGTWAWKYKLECLAFLLSLGIVGLILVADSYDRARQDAVLELKTYKIEQAKQALIAETTWKAQAAVAEERFNEKTKELERASAALDANTVRMSAALDEAQRKYAAASESARIEYTNALNTVSSQCIARYRWMAQIADGHAADADRLRQAWPTTQKPP